MALSKKAAEEEEEEINIRIKSFRSVKFSIFVVCMQ